MEKIQEQREIMAYECEKANVICSFLVKSNFATGVVSSEHYHFHAFYELHLPINGTLRILADDKELVVQPGEVCIIPPEIPHYVYDTLNSRKTGFRFSFTIVGQKETGLQSLFLKTFGLLSEACVIRDCRIYEKYLSTAIDKFLGKAPEMITVELFFLAVYEVACILDDAHTAPKTGSGLSEIIMSARIEEFFNEHYSQKLYLQDLAAHLNLSARQTERIVEKLFGISFSALLSKKRLLAARFLLRTTDLSVDEIVTRVGFQDKSYFYRKFRAAFMQTPAEYRMLTTRSCK